MLTSLCLTLCKANNDSILPKSDFAVSVYCLAYQGLRITPIGNEKLLKSGIAPTAKFEVSFRHRLYQTYYVDAGIGFTMVPVFFKYNIKLDPNHPLYTQNNIKTIEDKSLYIDVLPSLNIGFQVSNQFKMQPNLFLNTGIGVDLNFYPTFHVSFSNYYGLNGQSADSSYEFFELNLEDPIPTSAVAFGMFSYSVKVGLTKYNQKSNSWEINLKCNYQPEIIGKGTYEFDMGNEIKQGTVKWRNNYIGLQVVKRWRCGKQYGG